MIVYGLIAGAVGYALYKERQALGCPDVPDGTDCDNANGKAVKGTKPFITDSLEVIFKKIKEAADFADKWVMWRIAFLISVPATFLIYYFTHHRIPVEKELLIGMFVITSTVYFTLNFYKFHLINYAQKNIDEGVDLVAKKISL
jgi:hypothetical protein